MNEAAVTSTVLMIRPAAFAANLETAESNRFQRRVTASSRVHQAAAEEFDAAVVSLMGAGISVEVIEDTQAPPKPDAVFPNNWVSFHADGTVCLYPMLAPNRRRERRPEILQFLEQERGYAIRHVEDMSAAEQHGRYLEGTGSLVLDRAHRIAYACLSPRTDPDLVRAWCDKFGYHPVMFRAADAGGAAIYHTNVMLFVGDRFAVACLDCIPDQTERESVAGTLRETGHQIVPIDMAQLAQFAGNMLLLGDARGARVLAMSTRAQRSLNKRQREMLQSFARTVASPLTTIEDCAGGSMRCMMAELYLPRS